jgi:hypothetical protein
MPWYVSQERILDLAGLLTAARNSRDKRAVKSSLLHPELPTPIEISMQQSKNLEPQEGRKDDLTDFTRTSKTTC